jgi:hypothetical protein
MPSARRKDAAGNPLMLPAKPELTTVTLFEITLKKPEQTKVEAKNNTRLAIVHSSG